MKSTASAFTLFLLACCLCEGLVSQNHHFTNSLRRPAQRLFCQGTNSAPHNRNSAECQSSAIPQPVWSSRRGMLASAVSAVMSPYFLPSLSKAATMAQQEQGDNIAWMADPSSIVPTKQMAKILQQQATEAANQVTQQNIDQYNKIGVTKVENVISKQWIQALRDGCELAQDEAGEYAEYLNKPTDAGIFFTDLEMARRLPLFSAFALNGPAAAVAGRVMGSTEVRYLYDQLFVKEEGVTTQTPWHQDGGYWRVKGDQVTSVFVPLDPVLPNEGLQFVAGSHTWQLHNPHHFADGTPYVGTSLPDMPDIDSMQQRKEITFETFSLQPGDALVFSARTVHGGPGNWGRALSTRWVGDNARFWDRPGEGAIPTLDVQLRDGDLLAQNSLAFPTGWQQKGAV